MLQRLLRKNQETDPIRESAALTTVYLLELNRKFEAFVREKIAQLEPVVSSLEARGGQVDEDEWGDNFEPDKTEVSPTPDDGPPLPETNLVTRMSSPATDPDGDIASPAAPPGKEPGRAHRSLRNETGVGASFSYNMLDEGVGAGTDKLSPAWPAEKDNDKPATGNLGGEVTLEAEPDGTDALDEGMEDWDWERELGANDDDDPQPTGPLGEFE